MKFVLALSALLVSGVASAVDVPTSGTPVRLDVTNTSIAAWHTANGNATGCDDYFGAGMERLNVQGSWGGWGAGVRMDGSGFWNTPGPYGSKTYRWPELSQPQGTFPGCAKSELNNRYQPTLLPEKLWLNWAGRNVEVTLGDTYVSFGRGMTLSLRKSDEFGLDTTQRGVRIKANSELFSGTLIAGVANINNLDEASGRYQADTNDGILGASGDVRVLGNVRAGLNASAFIFHDPVQTSNATEDHTYQERWIMAGPKLDAPRITDWLGVYLEGVAQQRNRPDGTTEHGFGAYGSATVNMGAVTALVEGKAYGDLAVVHPNYADPTFSDPFRISNHDFDAVQYNSLPTLERVAQPIKHPQQDIYGGRVRLDWTINPVLSVFVNEGLFRDSYDGGYYTLNFEDHAPGIINDPYVGLDTRIGPQRIHAEAGYRWVTLQGGAGNSMSDGHLDVDVVRAFEGGHTVEMHLVHMERTDLSLDKAWREGTLQLGYRLRPRYAVSGILDYTTEELGQPSIWYPGGTVEYDFTEASNVKLFAGSMRGGLKCISGVCKVFPPFSGVKGTLTLRF